VNSYSQGGYDFPRLLAALDALPGDYWLRFMTSHPRDCSHALLDTMAGGRHIARHLHLPVQSGSDRVLREMNRGYAAAHYLDLLGYARAAMPGLSVTSDIIVGFPGESYEEFRGTLALVEQARFTSLFTFLYSPREGTRAAALPDPVPHAEKVRWFQELTALQEGAAAARCAQMVGQALRVLCEGPGKRLALAGRTEGNQIVEFDGPEECVGQFAQVRVTQVQNWLLQGELI
jgi:tRNA-2-methylthio-N6-dimethylallyladenosine synthase